MVAASVQALVSFFPPPYQTSSRQDTSIICKAASISPICLSDPVTILLFVEKL